MRWRCYLETPPYLLNGGADIGADGLLGRKVVGKGVAIFCQVDPDALNADEKTYFRYTRWRATRTVSQLLANLGASFMIDSRFFHPLEMVDRPDRMWIGPDGDRAGRQATWFATPGHPVHPPESVYASSTIPDGIPTGYYYPDYRTDFEMGDNPYHYYRY